MGKSTAPLFQGAPSEYLRMPQEGNITCLEIAVFLPNWLRSHDVVFRLASNGHKTEYTASMINYFHIPTDKGPVSNNTLCKMFETAMSNKRMESWTHQTHRENNLRNEHGPWDPNDLTLTGKHPQIYYSDILHNSRHQKRSVIENVPFKSLAAHVARFPDHQRGDGLDLTLCVKHAVENPEYNFLFPRDFKMLTRMLGGELTVRPEHLDGATFRRWKKGRYPNPPIPLIVRMPRTTAPVGSTSQRIAAQSGATQVAHPRAARGRPSRGTAAARQRSSDSQTEDRPPQTIRGQPRGARSSALNHDLSGSDEENLDAPRYRYSFLSASITGSRGGRQPLSTRSRQGSPSILGQFPALDISEDDSLTFFQEEVPGYQGYEEGGAIEDQPVQSGPYYTSGASSMPPSLPTSPSRPIPEEDSAAQLDLSHSPFDPSITASTSHDNGNVEGGPSANDSPEMQEFFDFPS